MNRNLLSLGLAAASLFAAPFAFAQSTNADATPEPQQDTSAVPETPAQPANQITWSELDADHDGALSKTEAAPVESLSMAFDTADTDKDGSLTADEYKAYRATNQESPAPQSPIPQQESPPPQP